MKTKKLVIFGDSDIAQIANYYFEIDSEYEVVAFTVDADYCSTEEFEGKPLVPFENIENRYGVNDVEMFIAVSYAKMNRIRAQKYREAKEKGYKIASYISSKCSFLSQFPPGENAFIFEDNTIQPFVKIKENVTLWSGNHIGHHSIIEPHNFVSSHVVISGHCHIKSNCFLGVNSTVGHKVVLEEGTLLGAGVIITKNTEKDSVYVPAKGRMIERKSSEIQL